MSVASEYADLFTVAGRRVVLERPVANAAPLRVENVRARLWGAAPEEIAGGVSSNERHVIILAADVPAAMLPLRKNDKILVDGLRLTFNERPDDQTHRDGELLLAIEGMVAGS